MPWKECDRMTLRYEFVQLASLEGANLALLCRRFGISRKTGYKWLERYRAAGLEGLRDRSRRPLRSPRRTCASMEAEVLALRRKHPRWGGRKLGRRLCDTDHTDVPAASTITEILRRHGEIAPSASEARRRVWRRFERPEPNDLWQMDFKGQFRLATQQYCYPLTVLDDHSRFNLILQAGFRQDRVRVQGALEGGFRLYGLPIAILADNGVPWCGRHAGSLSRLSLWLMRLGIEVLHGRSYHPQTQGKAERFNRTFEAEVLSGRQLRDGPHAQNEFDRWREVYNYQRPHEALGLETPSTRYRPSPRPYPECLPPVVYAPGETTRKVHRGLIYYAGRTLWVGCTLDGEHVAIRPARDDWIRICYGAFAIGQADLGAIPRGEYGRARLFSSLRCATLREQPGPTEP